jgi:phosphotransferase system HPr (HPr) family protein
MKEASYKITDPVWMHPGTAISFVDKMQRFSCNVIVIKGNNRGNGKDFFGVMKLKNLKGDITTIRVEGSDEDAAIKTVQEFFKENIPFK